MDRRAAAAIEDLKASTHTLQRSICDLSDDEIAELSLCPGWTRGHVLSHVSRNADALMNLVTWARTGVETPMYPSREHRDADISFGATRPAADIVADVTQSHERLMDAMAALGDHQWQRTIRWGRDYRETRAVMIPVLRRVEVEVHHVDLDLDYTLAHLPSAFVRRLLASTAEELATRDDLAGFVLVGNDDEGRWVIGGGGPEITGTPPSLLGWLLGRTEGIGLYSADPLPELGPWR